jgi:hypothetical protein
MAQTEERPLLTFVRGRSTLSLRRDYGYFSTSTASRQAGIYWRLLGRCSGNQSRPDSRGNVGRRNTSHPSRVLRDRALLGTGSTSHHEAVGLGVRDAGQRRSWHEGAEAITAHSPRSGVRTHAPSGSGQQGKPARACSPTYDQAQHVAASTAYQRPSQLPPGEILGVGVGHRSTLEV